MTRFRIAWNPLELFISDNSDEENIKRPASKGVFRGLPIEPDIQSSDEDDELTALPHPPAPANT